MELVSIIICTCNRAESLKATLLSFGRVIIPSEYDAELIVVDNGSSDNTAEIAKSYAPDIFKTSIVLEKKRGLDNARNTGICHSRGNVILFVDDDVHPNTEWLKSMLEPFSQNEIMGVAGGIHIAPHLERPWMKGKLRTYLAETDPTSVNQDDLTLTGGNMAFSRLVLNIIPEFDPQLDAGQTGFGGDTLFSFQMKKNGIPIIAASSESTLEHHFDPSRLSRASFISTSENIGKTGAYLDYHWSHNETPASSFSVAKAKLKLAIKRTLRHKRTLAPDGIEEWEMNAISEVAYQEQLLIEQKRPRNYEKYGLTRIR